MRENRTILLLSGPLAVGKTSIATELESFHAFRRIRTGQYLANLAAMGGATSNRTDLQEIGDSLDAQTDFRWVVDEVAAPAIESDETTDRWLFDSVRKHKQIDHFRSRYGREIFHLHLTASESFLEKRYEDRLKSAGEYAGNVPYAVACIHSNEVASRSLIDVADTVLDVEGKQIEELAEIVFAVAHSRKTA